MKLAPTYPAAALTQSPPVISVRGVTQRFGGAGAPQTVLALDNVSLDIGRGEFLTLLGPSGCGKSTLLNIIGGLLAPTEGAVTVNDTAVRGPLPEKIAFVFQESTLFPWYTVAENFALNFKYRGVARFEWRERTIAALKSVQMDTFADHFPNQLSIGMRHRLVRPRRHQDGEGHARPEDRGRRVGSARRTQDTRPEPPAVERTPVLGERPLVARPARIEVIDIRREPLARDGFVVIDGHEPRRVVHQRSLPATRPQSRAANRPAPMSRESPRPASRTAAMSSGDGPSGSSRSTGPTTPIAPAGSPR